MPDVAKGAVRWKRRYHPTVLCLLVVCFKFPYVLDHMIDWGELRIDFYNAGFTRGETSLHISEEDLRLEIGEEWNLDIHIL